MCHLAFSLGSHFLKKIGGTVVIPGEMGHIDRHDIPLESHPLMRGLFISLSAQESKLNFRARVSSLMFKAGYSAPSLGSFTMVQK